MIFFSYISPSILKSLLTKIIFFINITYIFTFFFTHTLFYSNYKNSAVTGDTIMNTRTETINDREFFDMGTKPRTMYGGGYSRAVKAREDALLMQRGRLKKTERIPDDIMQGKVYSKRKRACNRVYGKAL
jgi:hypothetical protein